MTHDKTIALKVCGMRDHLNIAQVAAIGLQYMGFIFYPKSPRFVGNDFSLPDSLPASVKKVGVFVNEMNDVILTKSHALVLDFVQLHGNESPEQCRQLRSAGLKLIKAFPVDDDFDFEVTRLYRDSVEYFLFDTKGKYFGGNAIPFNWNILKRYDQSKPFFLSGGLSPENIEHIKHLDKLNIHALDLNSGVELSPGLKNIEKLNEVLGKLSGTGYRLQSAT